MFDKMLLNYILDADGATPIPVDMDNPEQRERWLAFWKDDAVRVVLQEDLEHPATGAQVFLSTVFLGLDHNFSHHEDARPVLWETMAFLRGAMLSDPPDPHVLASMGLSEAARTVEKTWNNELAQWRYASRAEAEAGHARIKRALERALAEGCCTTEALRERLEEVLDEMETGAAEHDGEVSVL